MRSSAATATTAPSARSSKTWSKWRANLRQRASRATARGAASMWVRDRFAGVKREAGNPGQGRLAPSVRLLEHWRLFLCDSVPSSIHSEYPLDVQLIPIHRGFAVYFGKHAAKEAHARDWFNTTFLVFPPTVYPISRGWAVQSSLAARIRRHALSQPYTQSRELLQVHVRIHGCHCLGAPHAEVEFSPSVQRSI
jgi:hypothetical protein